MSDQPLRTGYADPPYLGCCGLYEHHHPDGRCWDDVETHARLIARLSVEFPDGWALSASSPSLVDLLPLCPRDCRISPWVKPFAVFKPNVNPAYAWEPVIWRGGRKRTREAPTVRDWHAANITLQRGLTGAKPQSVCFWIFDLLGLEPGDEFVDVFPGTGAVSQAWQRFTERLPLAVGDPHA
jgi:hypothetical protein